MQYKDLELKRNNDTVAFTWKGKEINIKKYLPVEDKYDVVMITIQKAAEGSIYNPIKLDMFFHLNLIYMYTDLEFSDEDRQDESKLYDEMKSTGFLNEFLKNIDNDEYKEMLEDIEDIICDTKQYNISAASVLKNFIDDLPANAEAAQKIVDNFDKNKYQAVVDFAKAANGDRPV